LLLNATINTYFPSSIATEVYCEFNLTSCDTDELSFKAYLMHGMAASTQLAPFTAEKIMPLLTSSAAAAAKQCSGGANGRMCGISWLNGSAWDGTQGAGQQMAVLEAFLGNLVQETEAPLTNATGGTSPGNPGAGVSRGNPGTPPVSVLNTGVVDTVGAGIVTVIVLVCLVGGLFWISSDMSEDDAKQKPLRDYILGFLISYLIIE
jgi:mannan endo-1,6-alpha-mannosidase